MLSHVGLSLSPKDESNVTVMPICDTLKCIWSFYIKMWVVRCDILLKCSFWLFYTNNINQNIYLGGIWLAREYGEGEDDGMI